VKLPVKFTLVIRGDRDRILERDIIDHGHQLSYLLHRLVTGGTVADGAFDPYYLSVEFEEDTDQGDET
jgi:hypothetical protein